MKKVCEKCHKEFEKASTTSFAKWERCRFCSKTCFWESGRVTKRCVTCGSIFQTKASYAEAIVTCGKAKCKTARRSEKAREQLLANGSPSSRPEVAKKIGHKIKKAFRDGRMSHMEAVYKRQSKKFEKARKKRNGYKMVWVDGSQRPEHCVIMEKKIGRPMERYEVVHHKNGKKYDNRLSNLQLMTISQHMKLHRAEHPDNYPHS